MLGSAKLANYDDDFEEIQMSWIKFRLIGECRFQWLDGC